MKRKCWVCGEKFVVDDRFKKVFQRTCNKFGCLAILVQANVLASKIHEDKEHPDKVRIPDINMDDKWVFNDVPINGFQLHCLMMRIFRVDILKRWEKNKTSTQEKG